MRVSGTNMNYHFFEEMGVPEPIRSSIVGTSCQPSLGLAVVPQAVTWVEWSASKVALSESERLRCNSIADALVASSFGLDSHDISHILRCCDLVEPHGHPTEFWRVDKEKDPELRHTILTQVAFRDLERSIDRAGDWHTGIRHFLDQNGGEGWLLPETVRLSDHGLGDDERARQPQPVACRLGPRVFDWQLGQSAEEVMREYHLHARNLRGADGYAHLVAALIELRGAVGEDGLDLLTDRDTCRLLGSDGHVTALLEIRARGVLDDDTYWAAAATLHDRGFMDDDQYGQLLATAADRRHTRCNPPVAEDAQRAQVAESGSGYQVGSPSSGRPGELFD